jgi:hypothetical protein
MTSARRRAIFRRLQEANPHPTTELLNDSPFRKPQPVGKLV